MGRLILETSRLLLREFDDGDVAAFHVLGSHPAIIRYTGDPGGGLRDVEHAREVLWSHPMADYREQRFGRWACVLKASSTVVDFGRSPNFSSSRKEAAFFGSTKPITRRSPSGSNPYRRTACPASGRQPAPPSSSAGIDSRCSAAAKKGDGEITESSVGTL